MNMIFEPMDLAAASPATVSRCGMIYMEPATMGWIPIYKSWKHTLPKHLTPEDLEEIEFLFLWTIDPCIEEIRHHGKEISPTQNQNLVKTLMNIYSGLLQDMDNEDARQLDIKVKHNILQQRFIFSLFWSIGGSVVYSFRKNFDIFVKRLLAGDVAVNLPEGLKPKKITNIPEKQIYEFTIIPKKEGDRTVNVDWIPWIDLIKNEDVQMQAKKKPQEILIPTADTVRYKFLLQHNIGLGIPTIFCGPTGTGKSIYIKNLLLSLPRANFMTIEIGFSA